MISHTCSQRDRRKYNTQHTPKKPSQNCCQKITKSTYVDPK